jgi:NAD(P)-dependent dehydrogenase (short-subunit alcohol dehydrogenase family)
MTTKLEGKIAVITGGNSGMGLATARRFVEEGAKVIITGRRQVELDAAVKSIGKNIEGVQGDVSNLADLDRLHDHIKTKYGKVDIVFANAGLGSFKPFDQITEEDFDLQVNVNFKGVFFTIQKLLPLVPEGGSILLNSSIAGTKGIENFSAYSATKAAVRSLARTLTSDFKAKKIRVNAISPGPIDTPIFGKAGVADDQIDGIKQGFASQVPVGRMGLGTDIANAALFLASNDSSFVSGIELTVDGGLAQV